MLGCLSPPPPHPSLYRVVADAAQSVGRVSGHSRILGDGRVLYLVAQATAAFSAGPGEEVGVDDGVAVLALNPAAQFDTVHSTRLWRGVNPNNIAVSVKSGNIMGGKLAAK